MLEINNITLATDYDTGLPTPFPHTPGPLLIPGDTGCGKTALMKKLLKDAAVDERENLQQAYQVITPRNISENSQGPPKTQDHIWEPDELAFAFCFDVLASLGSMTLQAISSLLAPWGWTRDSLLGRLNALQDDGLLMFGYTDRLGKKPIPHVSVTSQGKKLSEGRGLYSHRQRTGHETDGSPN